MGYSFVVGLSKMTVLDFQFRVPLQASTSSLGSNSIPEVSKFHPNVGNSGNPIDCVDASRTSDLGLSTYRRTSIDCPAPLGQDRLLPLE